jgi:hypothetical protein
MDARQWVTGAVASMVPVDVIDGRSRVQLGARTDPLHSEAPANESKASWITKPR